MRAHVQRVSRACVRVDGAVTGEIGPGLLVLLGVTHDDTEADADRLAAKGQRQNQATAGTDDDFDSGLMDD